MKQVRILLGYFACCVLALAPTPAGVTLRWSCHDHDMLVTACVFLDCLEHRLMTQREREITTCSAHVTACTAPGPVLLHMCRLIKSAIAGSCSDVSCIPCLVYASQSVSTVVLYIAQRLQVASQLVVARTFCCIRLYGICWRLVSYTVYMQMYAMCQKASMTLIGVAATSTTEQD